MRKIAMIAGEASGDLIASLLISSLQQKSTEELEFVGIGGAKMIANGFQSWHAMETLSVMGYLEVIKSLPSLLLLRRKIVQQLIEYKPDVFIGVDAPDFTFYVEYRLHKHGIKTVHYVSPTIWAWRYERIYKIKQSTDLMLCIFPFEPDIYHKEHIEAKFVGNPIANNIPFKIKPQEYKDKLDISSTVQNVFTILVGSRKREIIMHAMILIEACNLIVEDIPDSIFIFPLNNQHNVIMLQDILKQHQVKFAYKIVNNCSRDAIMASDMVISKSGTVSLETALCKKPMIIVYKTSKITEWIVRRQIKIQYVGQPNILLGKLVVPELLQEDANAQNIAREFLDIYNSPQRKKEMIAQFEQLHHNLYIPDMSVAAKSILHLIGDTSC